MAAAAGTCLLMKQRNGLPAAHQSHQVEPDRTKDGTADPGEPHVRGCPCCIDRSRLGRHSVQQVSVLGEESGAGAADPSLSVSGPGEVDLFGQRLPTTVQFAGPVRPRLALTRSTLNQQLASGWIRYFVFEAVIAGGCAVPADRRHCRVGTVLFPADAGAIGDRPDAHGIRPHPGRDVVIGGARLRPVSA